MGLKVSSYRDFPVESFDIRAKEQKTASFAEVLENFVSEVNNEQLEARELENALAKGKVKNFEEALFLIEKADLSFRFLVELRNKALESYQEIMRMQV